MDSQSIIVQANRDETCTEFPILSLPRPVPPPQNIQGLLLSCFCKLKFLVVFGSGTDRVSLLALLLLFLMLWRQSAMPKA